MNLLLHEILFRLHLKIGRGNVSLWGIYFIYFIVPHAAVVTGCLVKIPCDFLKMFPIPNSAIS